MSSEVRGGTACPACGADSPPDARFCPQCAASLDGTPPTAEGAERKQVTVLFSDLTGYTTLAERLDPEETREIMSGIFGRAAEIVARYEGRIEKFIGDAVMAVFGVPKAHEDDPVRAVRAALELHEVVAAMAAGVEARAGVPVALHSGINSGLVVTGELKFDHGTAGPVGDTINLAARLMGLAPAGEIWMGPLTRRLSAGQVDAVDLGPQVLKGKSAPVVAARVKGLLRDGATSRPGRTHFIGRQAELGALLAAVEGARDGKGSAFAIRAEAGGGKTRLMAELRSQLSSEVRWFEGRAYAYSRRIPYFPLINLLNRAFDIEEDDRRDEVASKLETGIAALLDGDAADVLPVIGRLYELELGHSAVIEKEVFVPRLIAAVRRLLQAGAEGAPAVVCLQDLHWADDPSSTLIRELLADASFPIVFVVNFRPGFELGVDGVETFDLPALSARQTGELVASMLDDTVPAELLSFVEGRTEGNPFFAEEIVNSLIETGTVVRAPEGWQLARTLDEAAVPMTIQGVLAARIDRLDESRRRILREAAVVGREFLYDIVRQISTAAEGLDQGLHALQAADLIREKEEQEYLEYIFKHALTQEVAYEGLLKNERQALHARVAEAIEELLQQRLGEFAETLAYHFTRGGVPAKAAHYLIEAGRKAFERYALEEADRSYREAFELLADQQRTRAEDQLLVKALIGWADTRYYDVNTIETGALLDRHLPTAQRLNEPGLLARYRARMVPPRILALDLRGACEIGREAARLGREQGEPEAEALGLTWLTFGLLSRGQIAEARERGEQAVAACASLPEAHDAHYDSRLYLTLVYLTAGDFGRARALRADLFERIERTGQQRAAPSAHLGSVYESLLLLDPDAVIRECDAGLAIVKDPLYVGWFLGYKTFGLVLSRRYAEARVTADAHLAHHARRPAEFCLTMSRFCQGLVSIAEGDLTGGMQACRAEIDFNRSVDGANAALNMCAGLGETYVRIVCREIVPSAGTMMRNTGFMVRHALAAPRRARVMLEAARGEAEECGMLGYTATIALSLARLHAAKRRTGEARAELLTCIEFLRSAGISDLPQEVRDLALRLGVEAAGAAP